MLLARRLQHDGLASTSSEDLKEPHDSSSRDDSSRLPHRSPRGIKLLNKILATRIVPDILEEDLQEQFVRGSGPGGQCINKTSSSVSLIHTPTGIRVQCQETRSLQQNRRIARRLLRDKIDQIENPGLAKQDIRAEKERRRKQNRAKKSKRKMREFSEELAMGKDETAAEG